MVELSLEQAFSQAEYYVKRGEVSEAQKFYKAILTAVPNNEKAQAALTALHKVQASTNTQSPPQEIINQLLNLYNSGNLEAVVKQASSLTEQYPDAFVVWNILGAAHRGLGDLNKASQSFKKVTELNPNYTNGHNNLGLVLLDQEKLDEAVEAFNKALSLKPDNAGAYNNMGIALQEQGKFDEAIASYNKALAIKPDYAEAHNNMGNTFKGQGELEEAIEAYKKALDLKPKYEAARSQKFHQQAQICDWKAVEKDFSLLLELVVSGEAIEPFSALALEDAPERHRLRSETYARKNFPVKLQKQFEKPSQMPERLRIGYFSADFKEHPASYLMFKVIECHDRSLFDVYGYSIGQPKFDKMREKISEAFDVFRDIHSLSDIEALKTIHNDKIDIAIDLTGYTNQCRTGLFSYRLAPIQINYLGYPGTLGADFIDYIVADQNLIPESFQKFYAESPIYLPHTYMPTDNNRKISESNMSRSEVGLPDNAFVFCCFNNNFKITESEFDIWMRVVAKVEGSVLWLRKSNQFSEINMRKEAKRRNIDPTRLVFAERIPIDEHIARQKLADLFIDTFAFNAHTTATEALWAGLPVVTKLGQGFAARVCGSLLNAIGLPELVAESEDDYEALILEIATQPNKLDKIKKKLEVNRLSQPLFNTEQYTKYLENGYLQAYQKYFDGEPPNTIIVPE